MARSLVGAQQHGVPPVFVGGPSPRARLAIHARNYEASLAAALASKFPATSWLAGADAVRAAGRAYVQARPPRRPCIAEYGADFPEFLAGFESTRRLAYLPAFAELEWAVGQVSIAVERTPLGWAAVATAGAERLLAARLTLQDGARYLRARFRVDELMKTFLQGNEPERFELAEADTCIEVRGARGAIAIERIEPAELAFRSSLAAGSSIEHAAGKALAVDDGFDVGDALRRVVRARLAVELRTPAEARDP
jgi:hypothetical protein